MYPPELSEEHALFLTSQILDWQINHGSLLKQIHTQTEQSVLSHPVGVTLFPTLFPRSHFERALELQAIFNELYCAVSQNEEWVFHAIEDLLQVDHLASALWEIHTKAKEQEYTQVLSCGIFRSDYMLQGGDVELQTKQADQSALSLKQVEFNTFSCAGATHANKVVSMHRHLTKTGAYNTSNNINTIDLCSLPQNSNIKSLASILTTAHAAYGPPNSKQATQTAVLFIVQPQNFNIADERPIEYALWDKEPPVPAYRLEFGQHVLQYTSLTESRDLLFHPPWLPKPVEVSVVYMRAGYEAHEYDAVGKESRLRLEISSAIKCPSLLAHICTFKKVQYALSAEGVLERFISPDKAAVIRSTFVQMYPFDLSKDGLHARYLATDPELSRKYILKPSLEGGGHNIYGDAIPDFLACIPESSWGAYILMERIVSPSVINVMMSHSGIDSGGVISELGVIGTCLWRNGSSHELLHNTTAGWTFKTKNEDVDEMSVVKGYGCFDTPLFI